MAVCNFHSQIYSSFVFRRLPAVSTKLLLQELHFHWWLMRSFRRVFFFCSGICVSRPYINSLRPGRRASPAHRPLSGWKVFKFSIKKRWSSNHRFCGRWNKGMQPSAATLSFGSPPFFPSGSGFVGLLTFTFRCNLFFNCISALISPSLRAITALPMTGFRRMQNALHRNGTL